MLDTVKEKLEPVKAFLDKFSAKTKKIVAIVAVAVVVFAVVLAFVLNRESYEVLFTGLNSDEAQQIIAKLKEDQIDFKYENDDTILVDSSMVDQVKADLVYAGYPESGFTYDVFTSNTNLMSTDSDKQTYLLYQLQNRIGATICLFEGVKDAKVTIALGENSNYVLSDAKEDSSATAVVQMKNGGSPTEEQALAIQRLVSKSVQGMDMDNVAVFDGNGNDVSVNSQSMNDISGEKSEEIANIIEQQIVNRVLNVLEPVYGNGAVKVSARATINMETLIREVTTYNTPEKIDENDKTGILSNEEGAWEVSGTDGVVSGVVGTDSNADVPEYNTEEIISDDGYASRQYSREYLVNKIIEQGQVDPGALEDLTVSVVIDAEDFGSLTQRELINLVGNAAGIVEEDKDGKISVVAAPCYSSRNASDADDSLNGITIDWKWLIIIAVATLIIIIVLITIIRKVLKKKKVEEIEEVEDIVIEIDPEKEKMDIISAAQQREAELRADRTVQLRDSVREFTDANPEISAQLLRNWLNDGKPDSGGGDKDE